MTRERTGKNESPMPVQRDLIVTVTLDASGAHRLAEDALRHYDEPNMYPVESAYKAAKALYKAAGDVLSEQELRTNVPTSIVYPSVGSSILYEYTTGGIEQRPAVTQMVIDQIVFIIHSIAGQYALVRIKEPHEGHNHVRMDMYMGGWRVTSVVRDIRYGLSYFLESRETEQQVASYLIQRISLIAANTQLSLRDRRILVDEEIIQGTALALLNEKNPHWDYVVRIFAQERDLLFPEDRVSADEERADFERNRDVPFALATVTDGLYKGETVNVEAVEGDQAICDRGSTSENELVRISTAHLNYWKSVSSIEIKDGRVVSSVPVEASKEST